MKLQQDYIFLKYEDCQKISILLVFKKMLFDNKVCKQVLMEVAVPALNQICASAEY